MPAIAHQNKILGNVNTLNDLTDVDLTSPQNGQVPIYNSTTQKWENSNVSASSVAYSNSSSGLSATNAQAAIDEVEGRVDTAETNIGTLTTSVGGLQTAVAGKEAAHTVLTSTLTAGSTTLTFTNAAIGNDSLIRVYSNPAGVNPLTASQSGTSVTLTFDAQQSNVSIAIEVRN